MRRSLSFAVAALLSAAALIAQQNPPTQTTAPRSKVLSDDLNRELPNWLRFTAEYRARVEGFTGEGFKPNNEDTYLLSRIRINMFLLPTKWLKFGFQGQDARVFWKNQTPASAPYQDPMDLRQGYLELGDIEKNTLEFALAGQQSVRSGTVGHETLSRSTG